MKVTMLKAYLGVVDNFNYWRNQVVLGWSEPLTVTEYNSNFGYGRSSDFGDVSFEAEEGETLEVEIVEDSIAVGRHMPGGNFARTDWARDIVVKPKRR